MKNPFEYTEPAEITKDERKVLSQMFGTPERINILRKAFQLTGNDERGYLMPASIQNFDFSISDKDDAEEVIESLKFKQEVDRYLKAVLANIHRENSSLFEEEVSPLQEEVEKLTKEIADKKAEVKNLNDKIREKDVTNTSTVGSSVNGGAILGHSSGGILRSRAV